ncbi:two-component system, OmpR family, phosphate regulon response regulator PhoB/two-component system, OmpR family, alkaline phosphatase synthesis response regulator PhoP [Persephonella hydrogeniphila]|uniref:Phosphate regulon transcriptional regulatory protein PhoB n=1 Tax=Persephonella hydrogeniphila TaxID=198703 RepID=A0A285N306_9AQUI|nr:response regulator transcription factor [Persephonella hydrogeniphila]SNZ02141.1 two-component system, OmpR family, phosphate regulon response regulator PhoB/two-component system, OmpR family, alkaline phosphatase synthesis response regulator PhoP [Persephonella hydrogeniphila]
MSLIYVVEDDEDINDLLVYNLKKENFQVKPFLNSVQALKEIQKNPPDLILLDIMLPDMDGLELCKKIRSNRETEHIPIIMITAKSTEIDKIVGLELGADDYITKPFSIKEVVARIRAILRRSKGVKNPGRIKIKGIEVFPEKFEIKVDGEPVNLTSKEFKLFMLLLSSENRVLSREEILAKVWEGEFDVYDRTVDVHIKKLRDKLAPYGNLIETVRGIGYRLKTD